MMSRLGAKIHTSLDFSPKGSNIVLLALVCIFAICLIAGFVFLWPRHEYSWVPFSFAGVLFFAIVSFWLISRKDIDNSSSVPTRVEAIDGPKSITVTTDTRSISFSEVFGLLEKCVSIVQHHRPLPEPDGLVDEKGNRIPDSETEARLRVKSANDRVEEIVDSVLTHSRTYGDGEMLEQQGSSDEDGRITSNMRDDLTNSSDSGNKLVDEH